MACKEGFVRIVDKVIKLPNFLQGVGRIKNMCFVVVEESRRDVLCKEVVIGMFHPHVASSISIHTGEMVDVIESFVTYDYATIMKLGSVDINVIRQLCADN